MPTLKIKKLRRRAKLKAFAERFGIIFSGMVFVLAGITYLARLDELTITSISLEGNKTIASKDILSVASEVLSSRYVFLPKRNIFIYPKDYLINTLEKDFPQLNSVDIKRLDLNTLIMRVGERRTHALWCGHEPSEEGDCFYVDDQSFVFAGAPYFSGDVFFRFYGGGVRSPNPVGSFVVPIDELSRLEVFLSYLSEIDLPPRAVYYKEKEIHIFLKKNSTLYIDRKDSFENAFSRLYSLIRGSEFDFIIEGEPNFEYIDLRFGRSVFYKP